MNHISTIICCIILLLLTLGCTARSIEDFQEEGEGVTRSLIHKLEAIRTRDQLLNASIQLQQYFDRLVTIMIAAEEWMDVQSGYFKSEDIGPNHELSDQLRTELNRIYQIEGGRQIIEKCQEKPLLRLDAFMKRRMNHAGS